MLEGAALEPASARRYNSAEQKLYRFLGGLGPTWHETRSAALRTDGAPGVGLFSPHFLRFFSSSEQLVCSFIEYSAQARYSYGTVVGDIFALRSRAVAFGVPAPEPLSPFANRLLAGYKKRFPPGAGKRIPLLAGDLLGFLGTLRAREAAETCLMPGAPFGRDPDASAAPKEELRQSTLLSAVLSTAFFGCLRVGEYTSMALQCKDVQLSQAALLLLRSIVAVSPAERRRVLSATLAAGHSDVFISLTLRHTKASPVASVVVTLWPGIPEACPVTELLLYMAMRRRAGAQSTGEHPFFATAGCSPISRATVARALLDLASVAGWSASERARLGPHSLRGGGATAASRGGASERAVMALGRWRSSAVRGYVNAQRMRARLAQAAMARELARGVGSRGAPE